MSSPFVQSNNKAGLCPHGLPPSACPICNGGMSSGGMKQQTTTRPINTEWSYMKCYAAGLAMRAQENRIQTAKEMFEKQLNYAQNLRTAINNLADKIRENLQNIQNSLPTLLQKPMTIITNFVINPILNLISQIPKVIEKFVQLEQNIHKFIQNAGEKIVALFGDIKNFIQRNITEKIKEKAKKFLLFFISNTEDENYKNDETLNIFKSREIKKYLVKFFSFNKKQEDKE